MAMKFSVQPSRDLPLLVFVSAAAVALLNWSTPEGADSTTERRVERHYGPAIAHARGSLAGLISPDDYPESALVHGEQGTVEFTLSINPRGRVSDCVITRSSGWASLDNATCAILQRRAKFFPARDAHGEPVADLHRNKIRWEVQDE
jgi:TonB family protein